MVFALNLNMNRGVFKVLPTHPCHKFLEVIPLGPYISLCHHSSCWKTIGHVISWESLDSHNYIEHCIEFFN